MAIDPAPPEPTIPCETCGFPTEMTATKRCNRCWAVEGHLPEYVRTERGRAFVDALLARTPKQATVSAPETCPDCKLSATICLCGDEGETGHDSSEAK